MTNSNLLAIVVPAFKGKYLEKTLKLDSTYSDAYLGLGAYHYYKTVKSKAFLWLPFVVDRREQGIEELNLCVNSGLLA